MAKRGNLHFESYREELKKILFVSGPASAGFLCRRLGISQPSFSRLVGQLSEEVLRIGKGRSIQYALRRRDAGGAGKIPVFKVSEDGSVSQAAWLYCLAAKGYFLESISEIFSSKYFSGLPYFFEDLRPSGFLGRLVPRLYPEEKFPANIQNFSDEDCLRYLSAYGEDLVGNYIIGEAAFKKFLGGSLHGPTVVEEDRREEIYARMADQAMSAGIPGSSAAGEHPKFLATKFSAERRVPVMVKFSPRINDALSRRVADLLVCEHVAHEVLRGAGQESAKSSILEDGERVFLEIERFDRTPQGGRRGLVSLRALDLEFVGALRSWSDTAEGLSSRRIIMPETLARIRWLENFGNLIGNTDMHLGNLSFFSDGERLLGVAPVYDMLPMMYAPQQNQLVSREFKPEMPKSAEVVEWTNAWKAAMDFWRRVDEHSLISLDFKEVARRHAARCGELEGIHRILRSD
ncbi:MAG: type II toxin-antitoxin system HipA family toxin YjjJ [Deltaproteobacteria bacterium]|nr:type II toxin-antitoxin system HipA family toxin YjjJ [Deltaproteobacteria bacterium]